MPRKGYASLKLTPYLVEAIDKLLKDKDFIDEMMKAGHTQVSRALIVRTALFAYLKDKGIIPTSEVEGK